MTRRVLAAAALALSSMLFLSACTGASPDASPSSAATPSQSATPTRSTTPKPTQTPEPYAFAIECWGDDYKRIKFSDYRAVWASSAALIGCDDAGMSGKFLTDQQTAALTAAYGHQNVSSLGTLYAICASIHFSSYGKLPSYSNAQIPEVQAALSLCPDQPAASDIQAKLDASTQIEADRVAGTRFGGGIRQVGVNLQPGTYVSEGSITNCYWEKLDSAGNIIENNFLGSALRVEVYIDPSDFSFSSSSCGEWVRQG